MHARNLSQAIKPSLLHRATMQEISRFPSHFPTKNKLQKTNIISSITDFRALRQKWIDKSVAFVPTMGALHDGHLSLIKEAKKNADKVVISIFVNPSQFSPTEDIDTYPRFLESDVEKINSIGGADCVFTPMVSEMYPMGIPLDVSKQVGAFVEVKGLSHQMEGAIRPHFFRGVATVVTKLLNVTTPTTMYLGQKDAQQCSVLKSVVRDLLIPTKIIVCPTLRESDGLAMSSRNAYLNPEERSLAVCLNEALLVGESLFNRRQGKVTGVELAEVAKGYINDVEERSNGLVKFEYFGINEVESFDDCLSGGLDGVGKSFVFSGAIRVGKTRLIDNVILKNKLF